MYRKLEETVINTVITSIGCVLAVFLATILCGTSSVYAEDKEKESITEAKVLNDKVVDGFAPFDNEDGEGMDSSDSNGIVRTFDGLVYPLEITLSNKEITKIRVRISGEIFGAVGKLSYGSSDGEFAVSKKGKTVESDVLNSSDFSYEESLDVLNGEAISNIELQILGGNNRDKIQLRNLAVTLLEEDGKEVKDETPKEVADSKDISIVGSTSIAGRIEGNEGELKKVTEEVTGMDEEDSKRFSHSYVAPIYNMTSIVPMSNKEGIKGATVQGEDMMTDYVIKRKVLWDDGRVEEKVITESHDDVEVYGLNTMYVGEGTPKGSKWDYLSYADKKGWKIDEDYIKSVDENSPFPYSKRGENSKESDSNTVENTGRFENIDGYMYISPKISEYSIGKTFPTVAVNGQELSENEKPIQVNKTLLLLENRYYVGSENNPDSIGNVVEYEITAKGLGMYFSKDFYNFDYNIYGKVVYKIRNDVEVEDNVTVAYNNIALGRPNGSYSEKDRTIPYGDSLEVKGGNVELVGRFKIDGNTFGEKTVLFKWNNTALQLDKVEEIEIDGKEIPIDEVKVQYGVMKDEERGKEEDVIVNGRSKEYEWINDKLEGSERSKISSIKITVPKKYEGREIFLRNKLKVATDREGSVDKNNVSNIVSGSVEIGKDVKNNYNYYSEGIEKFIPTKYNDKMELVEEQSPVGSRIDTLGVVDNYIRGEIVSDKEGYQLGENQKFKIKSKLLTKYRGKGLTLTWRIKVPKELKVDKESVKYGNESIDLEEIKNNEIEISLPNFNDNEVKDISYETSVNTAEKMSDRLRTEVKIGTSIDDYEGKESVLENEIVVKSNKDNEENEESKENETTEDSDDSDNINVTEGTNQKSILKDTSKGGKENAIEDKKEDKENKKGLPRTGSERFNILEYSILLATVGFCLLRSRKDREKNRW